jgi:hypothetical protein
VSVPASRDSFHQRKDIPAALTLIQDRVHQLAHHVNSKPADWPPFERCLGIRGRKRERVKWTTIVFDLHAHLALALLESDRNPMLARTIVGIRDDVRDPFRERKVDGVLNFFGETAPPREVTHPIPDLPCPGWIISQPVFSDEVHPASGRGKRSRGPGLSTLNHLLAKAGHGEDGIDLRRRIGDP